MTNKVCIRVCNPGDVNALALLGQATFLESFAGLLDGIGILGHCANQHSSAVYRGWFEPGGAPVGYLVFVPPILPTVDTYADDLEIKRLYLLHPFQRNGVGRRLMEKALAHARKQNCRRVLLEVLPATRALLSFIKNSDL